MQSIIVISIFALIIIFIINLGYKYLINQEEAKQIKERQKELNKKMKEEHKAGNKEKYNQILSETLRENNKLMKMTMKPMLLSLVIVALILPLIQANYGDLNIENNQTQIIVNNIKYNVSYSEDKIFIAENQYTIPSRIDFAGDRWNVDKEGDKTHLKRIIALLPVTLPYVHDDLGWLGWYFIVSLPSMIVFRKLMGIRI